MNKGILILILCGIQGLSADYFVRKDGNDGNSGTANTSADAWLTITHAAATVAAGDAVTVGAGTYNERVLTQVAGTEGSPITFSASSGVTSGGFTIRHPWYRVNGFTLNDYGLTGYEGVIELRASGHNFIATSNTLTSTSPYAYLVTTTSLSFTTNATFNGNNFGETMSHALILVGSGHVVTNNHFSTANGGDAIKIHSDNTTVIHNVLTNWSNIPRTNGALTVGCVYFFDGTNGSPNFANVGAGSPPYQIGESYTWTATNTTPTSWGSSSVMRANHTDLIQTFAYDPSESSTNVVIDGNLFINCRNCQIGNIEDQAELGRVGWWTWRNNVWANVDWVMSIFGHNFHFYNNTFYRSGNNSGHPLIFTTSGDRGNAHSGKVWNNIFVECGSLPETSTRGWFDFGVGLTNCTADYNLVVGTGAGTTKTGFADVHGVNGSDPLFVSAGSDFALQSGSPAIGAGTDLSAYFTTDFTGTARSAPWDIGAYEYSAGDPPPPPSGSSATATSATVGTLIVR